jgi:exosortase
MPAVSDEMLPVGASKSRLNIGFPALAVAALWLAVFNHLRLEWTVNPLYTYGWSIPALAAYLFWERWISRPAPSPGGGSGILAVVAGVCVLGYPPLRLIGEANPDWIMLSWLFVILGVVVTLGLVHHAGGRPWLLHFGFPVLFIFTAVPWPVPVENFLLQNLMQVNATLTAETLTLCNIPALAIGNVILIGKESVGVDEACSGIRSLQTAFMMSLFLGEFYRMGIWRRAILVLASFALAFVFNLFRTLILTYVGGRDGSEGLDAWHDPLGLAVLAFCITGLWLLAFLMNRRAQKAPVPSVRQPVPRGRTPKLAFASVLLAVGVAAEIGTVAWFHLRERELPPAVKWTADWPSNARNLQTQEFTERTWTILKYNEGKSAVWTSPTTGSRWTAYYLRWEPGRVAQNLASAHTPDVCLPATGLELVSDEGVRTVDVPGLQMPFHAYIFASSTRQSWVFHCLLDDRPEVNAAPRAGEPLSRASRIRNALEGRRNLGQRILGISITGPASLEEAEQELRHTLSQMITIQT